MIARSARGLTLRIVLVLMASALIIAGVVSLDQAQPAFATRPNTRQSES